MDKNVESNYIILNKGMWKKGKNGMYKGYVPVDETNEKHINMITEKLPLHYYKKDKTGEKDDEYAEKLRESGNEQFRNFKWIEAMELYNESLRMAPVGSVHISLGYANRSSCFLRMGMYAECLADIDLAKKSNYPEMLMPKLIERRNKCLLIKHIQCSNCVECIAERNWKPMLDFESDEKFPGMANVLKIQYNDEFGKHIVATQDLKVGQVIFQEDVFQFNTHTFQKTCCKTCQLHTKNFIPCPTCSHVMFCDENCMNSNEIHKITCGAIYFRKKNTIDLMESIVFAVNIFPNINDLIKFVENALATHNVIDSSTSTTTDQSKYGLFLRIWTPPPITKETRYTEIFMFYLMMMDIPGFKERFDTKTKRRFLQHLIWYHNEIIDSNSFQYSVNSTKFDSIQSMKFTFIILSFLNHSCIPNVEFSRHKNKFFGYVIRPIRKGEQLFRTYADDRQPKEKRHAHLLDFYQFDCNCSRCVPCFNEDDHERIKSDPDFESIASFNVQHLVIKRLRTEFKQRCCNFLNKYGHLPWTEEIHMVMGKYKRCINVECHAV